MVFAKQNTKQFVQNLNIFNIRQVFEAFLSSETIMLRTIFQRPEIRLATDFCDVAQTL